MRLLRMDGASSEPMGHWPRMPWHVGKLHHQLAEVIFRLETSSQANPRFHQCFMDEDLVGRMSRLCRATHPGQLRRVRHKHLPAGLALRCLQRYLAMVAERWLGPGAVQR